MGEWAGTRKRSINIPKDIFSHKENSLNCFGIHGIQESNMRRETGRGIMMRVVQINGGVFGSTGRIMFGISDIAKEHGIEVRCYSPVTTTNKNREPDHAYEKIGTYNCRRFNVFLSRITGYNGCFAYLETKRMLKSISEFSPEVIHLHNLHDSYVNLPILFEYIKKNNISVIWTLHDCWPFTGHCTHFTIAKCDKWQSGCKECSQYKLYPQSLFDNSSKMYKLKKQTFTGIKSAIIVTPSEWLANLVKQSYLSKYEIDVVNNGIDLSVFKPTESNFKEKHGLENKKVLLGVSFGWNNSKGLDIFIRLAKELDDNFRIVLVGTDDIVDTKLPSNIISIHRTQKQDELVEIYTAADLFVNPTREDTYPTVNMESLACGTPVLTFRTGGSPEIVDDSCGGVVDCNDYNALKTRIMKICSEDKNQFVSACIKRAAGFDAKKCFLLYIKLYQKIMLMK